jgi:hypothetical protein
LHLVAFGLTSRSLILGFQGSRALIGPLVTSYSLALVFAKFDAFIQILFKGSSGRGALFKEKTLELLDGSEAPRHRAAILLATSCIDFQANIASQSVDYEEANAGAVQIQRG